MVGVLTGCAQQEDGTAKPYPRDAAVHSDSAQDADGSGNCSPRTCAQLGTQCGVAADGCGGKVDCGGCPQGQTCGGGGTNKCGNGQCNHKSCVQLSAECGFASDGCSAVLDCGTCPTGRVCSSSNRCGCVATTCASQGAECGTIPDGCGGVLQCGSCPDPLVCGGMGPNKCGETPCTPTTCAAEGVSCDAISDKCGSVLECGTCAAPQTCGGAGQIGKCGCPPTTCTAQGKDCGSIPDGCGANLNCGTCTLPDTCGGSGTPNACGCPPTTCGAQGKNCGSISDGCGANLDCGTCTLPKTCAGSGTPNVCGCSPQNCPPVYQNSFESPDDFPTGWVTWHNCAADDTWSIQRDLYPAPGGGTYGLRFHTTAFLPSCDYPGAWAVSPTLPAQPGWTYRVEVWTRNAGNAGIIEIWFNDSSQTQVGYGGGAWSPDAWQYNADPEIVAVAPPSTVGFFLRMALNSPSEYADIDLITVNAEPP